MEDISVAKKTGEGKVAGRGVSAGRKSPEKLLEGGSLLFLRDACATTCFSKYVAGFTSRMLEHV
ncbi:hypothetical protein [Oecophyllibacter saccharovorans]|uniref:hypothetical protein n=1 Tax=Oecophyllibacter saccharovorans TaxID=2558360 RepID=UPI00116E577B|nr:hypothetical protein [Oecophyllibacter saccharovorans]TPW34759.1 hypothetical protein E3203_04300 [Oecophyllibacter saccharovorans]